MHDRYDLTDEQWARLEPLLPRERSDGRGRPWMPHRQVVKGSCGGPGTGAPWRDLPGGYGSWKTSTDGTGPGRATAPGRRCSTVSSAAATPTPTSRSSRSTPRRAAARLAGPPDGDANDLGAQDGLRPPRTPSRLAAGRQGVLVLANPALPGPTLHQDRDRDRGRTGRRHGDGGAAPAADHHSIGNITASGTPWNGR
jgi:hypothetical protein